MSIKEKIVTLLDVMPEKDAELLLQYIVGMYQLSPKTTWDTIEEVAPDEVDLQMLQEIDADPLCNDFVSSDALKEELGLL